MVMHESDIDTESAEPPTEPNGPESEASEQLKLQFRRQVDSEIAAVASGEDYYVLMLESESAGDWMTRVPAERRAVLKNQRLWRIPDNWEQWARIMHSNAPDELLYHIPETGVSVIVEDLSQGNHAKAGYKVTSIGKLVPVLTDTPDKSALVDLLERIEDAEDVDISPAVTDTLQVLVERWDQFKEEYMAYYDKWSHKRAWEAFKSEDDTTFDDWSIEPWETEQSVGHIVGDVCHEGRKICESVNERLMEAGVVSGSPTVELSMQDKPLPEGYRVQALVEAGCSPEEAVDYLMERLQHEMHHSWSRVREADYDTVRENVNAARDALNS